MYTVKTGNELFQTRFLDIATKVAMIDKKKKLRPVVYSQETPDSPKVFEFSL